MSVETTDPVVRAIRLATSDEEALQIELAHIEQTDNRPTENDPDDDG